jgi:hypothetical protein
VIRPAWLAILLAGCAPVQVGPKALPDITLCSEKPRRVLPPIPETVLIHIQRGKLVDYDEGGEVLLRAYDAARQEAMR